MMYQNDLGSLLIRSSSLLIILTPFIKSALKNEMESAKTTIFMGEWKVPKLLSRACCNMLKEIIINSPSKDYEEYLSVQIYIFEVKKLITNVKKP